MKRLTMCGVLVLILAIAGPTWAAGTVEEVTYYSNALGEERVALVYLPEGYAASGDEYPVVYLVPGWSGTSANWYSNPEFTNVLDQMFGNGLVRPFIFVEVDRSCTPWAPDLPFPIPSFLVNSELNGDHETAFVNDLVSWIDDTYRTITDRDHRIVFGRSAGGYDATRVALRHPDLFGGLGTQVGVIAMEVLPGAIPLLLSEYPDGPPYDFAPIAGQTSMFFFSWCTAMTPNLANPPWKVDLWIDQDGNLDPAVWQRFVSESNSRWAAELVAAGGDVDIFMDAGDQDFYLPFTTVFADVLDGLGLPYTLQVFHGDHDTPMATRLKSHVTYFFPLNATLELSPRIINGRNWWPLVEASLELPGDLDVADIDTSTLAITKINGEDLDEPLSALVASDVSDVNGNGRDDLTIWFWKPSLLRLLAELGIADHETFDVTVEGETAEGWFLAATDSQRAIHIEAARAVPLWPMTATAVAD